MCGLAGYLLRGLSDDPVVLAALLAGVRTRGPDDEGVALVRRSEGAIVRGSTNHTRPSIQARYPNLAGPPVRRVAHDLALGHTRYAIIDPSDGGHQPFLSADGSVVGILNGEIYNHVELRRDLGSEGIVCRTASDTEVLIEGFRAWGDELWPRMSGFWAAVLYDRRTGATTFSRDRMGVAPLYYRETPSGLFFASRITPLRDVPPASRAYDELAVRGFVLAGIKDFGSDTCFRDVKSFPPASVVRVGGDGAGLATAQLRRFWQLPASRLSCHDLSLEEAARGLRERLVRAVELRRRADLPVAFELSGGLDSSSVVAAAAVLGGRVPTYTVSVPERDELPYARAVAQRFGLTHQVLPAAGEQLLDEAAPFAAIMEEPYHSPNVFTSYHMRRRIKRDGFAVVVSGAGGDEVLGGYEYEFWDAVRDALWREGERWQAVRHVVGHHAGSVARLRHSARDAIGAFKQRLARSHQEATGARSPATPAEQLRRGYTERSFDARIRFHCEVAQLPYYLRNGDHLTMSIPLEHRFPFLDVDVVEFAARLPVSYLYRDGWSKFVLRRAFHDILPPEVLWRREKMGFPFPFVRFLTRHASVLAPHAQRAADVVLPGHRLPSYRDLVAADPLLLWRLCSTGLWLTHVR